MRYVLTLPLILWSFFTCAQQTMYDICPLQNSSNVPDCTVASADSSEVKLNEYIGQKPVVVVFFRGGWCPYCTRHLSALQTIHNEIDTLGYELIAITPDAVEHLDSADHRAGGLKYTLFSDPDAKAIQAFGIGWKVNDELFNKYKNEYSMDLEWWSNSKHHILPVPAVFVIKNGEIRYQHVDPNYSRRLSGNVLLSFLKALE